MNIWFACDPPAVSSIACRLPSASSSSATRRLSEGCRPPRTPSVMFSFAVTAMAGPASARTAAAILRASLARFSTGPPYSSVRRFQRGLRNAETR